MEDYKELFTAGNKAQLEKLKENENKSGWNKNIPIRYFFEKIKDELEELKEAFFEIDEDDLQCWYKNIRGEAADIANYAQMIILKCDKKIAERK